MHDATSAVTAPQLKTATATGAGGTLRRTASGGADAQRADDPSIPWTSSLPGGAIPLPLNLVHSLTRLVLSTNHTLNIHLELIVGRSSPFPCLAEQAVSGSLSRKRKGTQASSHLCCTCTLL